MPDTGPVRREVRISGIVQGVGFRPFVYALARRWSLAGFVGNDSTGVRIEVEGAPVAVAAFLEAVQVEAPPLASIDSVQVRDVPLLRQDGFMIVHSDALGPRRTSVSADMGTCDDCLREMRDPTDRRYRYPFTNCTNCGPRFTIVQDVPYDRATTTMSTFAMCADCAREYADPADRRFHAQPVCCPACGPQLRLLAAGGEQVSGDAIDTAAQCLSSGRIVAVKGLGGYHLAALAADQAAVAALRARKHREEKPFAVMVPDLQAAGAVVELSPAAEELLLSPQRPIVLLPRRADADIAAAVAPGNRELGVMLPYTPLHHLLMASLRAPLVLTSGNVSDEPIAYRDDDALQRLAGIADMFLVHDRPIHVRTDDSVARLSRGAPALVRRSRGYAPAPLVLPWAFDQPVLACGAELKNTFCLGTDRHAFVSHHIGDLENAETLHAFTEGIDHFCRLFDVRPQVVAYDLHPDYLSTKYALELDGVELVGVQHHHAHIASCLADNGETGPVIGVAFDGLGYGLDGTLWGGEFLVADLRSFTRVGHLAPVPMPGGAAAIRQPWRMAAAHLAMAYGPDVEHQIAGRHAEQWAAIQQLVGTGLHAPQTSSVGRLFDAVAALLGVRDTVTYEGQAAVELEQLADPAVTGGYDVLRPAETPFQLRGSDLVRAVVADQRSGQPPAAIATRFHRGLAQAVVQACELVREETGLDTVALSGGVWQNQLLLRMVCGDLEQRGARVLSHHQVPTNDGGISLGQAVIAATTGVSLVGGQGVPSGQRRRRRWP